MPSGVADGALIIDTGLDNKGFIRDAAQFKRAVETLTQAVNKGGQQMGRSMGGYLKALQQAGSASRDAAKGQSALEKEIARTEAAIARLNERQELARRKFEASREDAVAKATEKVGPYKGEEDYDLPFGHPETVEEWQERVSAAVNKAVEDFGSFEESATFRNLSAEAEFLNEKLAGMRAELAASREEGAGAGGGVAAAFANIARNAGQAAGAVAKIAGNAALSFLKKLAAGAQNAAIQLAKLAGRAVVTGLKKIGQLAGGAAKKLFGLGDAAKGGGDGFKHSLKNLMRYGLGIRSLFFLFNKLRNAIKEGFDAMAGADERVAAALTSLKGALSGLKGSLAAAFAPILTAVAPALTTLINLLTQAVNAIGMFFAAITGQGYFMAAKGMEAVGSAAGGASGSVKELKRQLAGFDELNILSAGNSGGGGGGGGGGSSGGYSYEKLPVAGFIADFAEQIKALVAAENWDGLGALFAAKINGAFEKANRLVSWDNLGAKITKIVDAVASTFNSFVSKIKWEKIGETFATGANTFVKAATQALTKFDFPALAASLTRGLNSFISHVEWRDLGRLIAKYAGTVVKSLLAALTTIEWADAGKAFADAVNGLFDDQSLFTAAGDTISTAITGFFEWSASFLDNFDAIQAADDIKAMLGRIKWGEIASGFWATAKAAFKKGGDFLKVILGGDVYDVQGDAVEQMWERGSGNASSKSYAESWAARLGKAVGNALGSIPWKSILEGAKEIFLDAFDGLLDGLFNSENGDIAIKIAAAIAGLKIAPTLIKGAIIKSLIGGGATGAASGAGAATEAGGVGGWLKTLLSGGGGLVGSTLGSAGILGGSVAVATLIAKKIIPEELDAEYSKRVYANNPSDPASMYNDPELGGYNIQDYDKLFGYTTENTKALKANTKATKEGTKATDQTTANRQAFARSGGDLNGWDEAFNGDMSGVVVNAGVKFTPQGAGGASYENRPLAWLQKVFEPGTDTQNRVELVKKIAGQTPATLFETSKVLGVFASLFKKNSKENPGWLFGTGLSVLASLFKKDNKETPGWLFGTALGVFSSLFKKNDKENPGWLYGTALGVLSTLSKKSGTDGITSIYGTVLGVLSTLAKKPGSKDTDDLYKKNIDVTATIKKAKNNEISWTVTQSQVAGNKLVMMAKAMGGVITAGGRSLDWWGSATKYASGTNRAHGTMFVAGEAGPEIVGHVNGRTEILNQSQLAQTMRSAVASGMLAALKGVTFTMPAMATGGVMPYEVSAQIAKSTADIQGTLNANNEDLIQTIISVAGQLVAAVGRIQPGQTGQGGTTAQQVIDEINRRTLMFGASPLKGV